MKPEVTDATTEQALLAAIVESSDDAIITKDLDGIITSWNRGAEIVFGYAADEAIGRSVSMLIPEDRQNEEPDILRRIRNGEKIDHYETLRIRKDGELINISLTVSPVRDGTGKIIGASKIARDITLRTRSERAERKVGYLKRIVTAQELERQRMARDLHDHLGQKMTALRLQFEKLYNDCEDSAPARESIVPIRALAGEIDRSIGYFSWEFRAPELEDTDLLSALQTFLNEWSQQFNIPAAFQRNKQPNAPLLRLGPEVETSLYRIAQEALNNIAKHANATTVAMMIQHTEGHLTMVIEDDGDGFDTTEHTTKNGPGGMGLTSMQERTEMIGGTLDIESSPGRGTSVIVKIPTDQVSS